MQCWYSITKILMTCCLCSQSRQVTYQFQCVTCHAAHWLCKATRYRCCSKPSLLGHPSVNTKAIHPVHQVASLAKVSCKVLIIKGIKALLVRAGEWRVCTYIGIVQNLVLDVLIWTSPTKWCTLGIFFTEWKVTSWHSRSVESISTKKAIHSIYNNIDVLNVNKDSSHRKGNNKHYLFRIARQTTIPTHAQASFLVLFYGVGLKSIDTPMIVKQWRSMVWLCLMDILPGNLIKVYIAIFDVFLIILFGNIIIYSLSNSLICIANVCNKDPSKFTSKLKNTMQCDKLKEDKFIGVA